MKKKTLALLFALLFFFPVLADPFDNERFDCAYLYIDMENTGGFVEIYYVDCDGRSREKILKRESGYAFVDTDYTVLLIAMPYDDYYFLGWGDEGLLERSIEIYLCRDLFLFPRFQEIGDCCEDEDDYNCFIQSLD